MENLKEFLELLKNLSIIGALLYAIAYLNSQYGTLKTSRDSYRLANWKEIHALLEEDAKIRLKIFAFLDKLENTNTVSVATLKSKHTSGKRAYLSPEMKEFHAVARHYEQMGAAIRLKYLPIDLLNEIVPFPDEFWDKTAELRSHIQQNWFGEGKELTAFLSNFQWLREKWHKHRA